MRKEITHHLEMQSMAAYLYVEAGKDWSAVHGGPVIGFNSGACSDLDTPTSRTFYLAPIHAQGHTI